MLRPGEAAEFSTWTPHWLSAVGAPAQVLVLMGRHGERAHLRVSTTSDQALHVSTDIEERDDAVRVPPLPASLRGRERGGQPGRRARA